MSCKIRSCETKDLEFDKKAERIYAWTYFIAIEGPKRDFKPGIVTVVNNFGKGGVGASERDYLLERLYLLKYFTFAKKM